MMQHLGNISYALALYRSQSSFVTMTEQLSHTTSHTLTADTHILNEKDNYNQRDKHGETAHSPVTPSSTWSRDESHTQPSKGVVPPALKISLK